MSELFEYLDCFNVQMYGMFECLKCSNELYFCILIFNIWIIDLFNIWIVWVMNY